MANTNTNIAKLYLLAYNSIQLIGWSYGLLSIFIYLFEWHSFNNLWISGGVRYTISTFQTLQLLEVIHCMVKIVPSNAFQTFIQILSRLVLVWGILNLVAESRSSVGVLLLLIGWSIAEITRYLYYALNLFDCVPHAITWLRYTLFIVLYPIGVSGELLTMVKAFPHIRDKQLLSIQLPNFANISFYYHYLLIVIMLTYIPFFPQLYFYMISQRNKMLSNGHNKNN